MLALLAEPGTASRAAEAAKFAANPEELPETESAAPDRASRQPLLASPAGGDSGCRVGLKQPGDVVRPLRLPGSDHSESASDRGSPVTVEDDTWAIAASRPTTGWFAVGSEKLAEKLAVK